MPLGLSSPAMVSSAGGAPCGDVPPQPASASQLSPEATRASEVGVLPWITPAAQEPGLARGPRTLAPGCGPARGDESRGAPAGLPPTPQRAPRYRSRHVDVTFRWSRLVARRRLAGQSVEI